MNIWEQIYSDIQPLTSKWHEFFSVCWIFQLGQNSNIQPRANPCQCFPSIKMCLVCIIHLLQPPNKGVFHILIKNALGLIVTPPHSPHSHKKNITKCWKSSSALLTVNSEPISGQGWEGGLTKLRLWTKLGNNFSPSETYISLNSVQSRMRRSTNMAQKSFISKIQYPCACVAKA